jgi:hypothetical protein
MVLDGNQCTILWHVDDLKKVSHVDANIVTAIINQLEAEFGIDSLCFAMHVASRWKSLNLDNLTFKNLFQLYQKLVQGPKGIRIVLLYIVCSFVHLL